MKSDFVANVSHELRTPLTAVKGSLGLILGGVAGPIAPEVEKLLRIAEGNADRLIRLVNEILDIAKIESGAMLVRPIEQPLEPTVSQAAARVQGFAQTHGIAIVVEPVENNPIVMMDADRMEQVLINLLSNAVKCSEQGSEVVVRVRPCGGAIEIDVLDRGHGIPPEAIDRVFEKFFQVERMTNKAKEGTGLGLAISRAIIEDHGGQISVKSGLNQGTVFTISLPWDGKSLPLSHENLKNLDLTT